MRYLNTQSDALLKESVMCYFDKTKEEINQILDSILYSNNIEDETDKIVENYAKTELDYIQMYHLSRRLNGTDLSECNNLKNLLLKDSELSKFFEKYEITFRKHENYIDIFYKNMLIDLNDEKYEDYQSNIKFRLKEDYCINGFAFRENLKDDDYYLTLRHYGPEIVYSVQNLLNVDNMICDYKHNSQYYCIEYLIPISKIIFDGNETCVNDLDKTKFLLKESIKRLCNVRICKQSENLVLRLPDNEDVHQEWYVSTENLSDID